MKMYYLEVKEITLAPLLKWIWKKFTIWNFNLAHALIFDDKNVQVLKWKSHISRKMYRSKCVHENSKFNKRIDSSSVQRYRILFR